MRQEDEARFSTVLPIEDDKFERLRPQLLHSLPVNALNFCSFTMCRRPRQTGFAEEEATKTGDILIAVPGLHDGHVNVTALPMDERIATITEPKDIKTGMVMAIGLHYLQGEMLVLVGYESGYTCVWKQHSQIKRWQMTYSHNTHSQPVLSMDIAPDLSVFYTSSADAVIAQHPLIEGSGGTKTAQTKHAGQQSLHVRSDHKIFATAGWDGRVRVYSTRTMDELAVLKWHKEGCYALAFAAIIGEDTISESADGTVVKRGLTVAEQRTAKAKSTHWLAAGSKDGKVSLWDIY